MASCISNVKDPDTGETLELELKLVENAKAELTMVDMPVTPGSATPKPLILTREPAKNQGANAGGEQDRRAFLGAWRGQFNGKTYILAKPERGGRHAGWRSERWRFWH